MDTHRKKGVLDVCVLAVLAGGPSYGYKIVSDVSRCIEISESTLYPILRRLEAQGFDTFIECGPGSVLRRLTQKNLDACTACSVEDMAGVARLKELGL